MNPSNRSSASLSFVAVLLCGCAAYQQCGFSGCPGDAQISAEVRHVFEQHPGLGPATIFNIKTLNGVVYLGGIVDTDMQKQEAEELAQQVLHVKKVVSSLSPRNGAF